MTIYLTAGHHINAATGRGTGAFGVKCAQYPNGFDEAAEAIVLRDLVSKRLRDLGLKVINDKNDTPLASVVTWLRQAATKGDACIEIHFNAAAATATGVEAVVEDNHTPREAELARSLCFAVNTASGIRIRERVSGRRGVILERETARGRIGFLHSPQVAHNVLLEVCFCTSPTDVEKYFNNRNEIAAEIAAQIIFWS
jgi:N-acetylmuramoyl-L-alanine amidase